MKCFVWSETLDTGAYHKDGSAIVIAASLEEAIQMLREAESNENSYQYASPASEEVPTSVFDVLDSESPRIIARESGCDC